MNFRLSDKLVSTGNPKFLIECGHLCKSKQPTEEFLILYDVTINLHY